MTSQPRTGHDLRLAPIAVAAWAVSWLVVTGEPWARGVGVTAAGIALVLGVWSAALRRWLTAAALLAVVAGAGIGIIRTDNLSDPAVRQLGVERSFVVATASVRAEARMSQKGGRAPFASVGVDLATLDGRGVRVGADLPAVLTGSGDLASALAALEPGSLVEVRAIAGLPDPGRPVALVLRLRSPPVVLAGPGPVDALVNRVRSGLVASMQASPAQQAALVPSLVVGDTSAVDQELADQFKATALTHLLAVSGANLTLLVGFLLVVAKALGARGWWIRAVVAFGVVAFVFVCRGEPSVLRAAAMGGVALAALGTGRDRAKGLRHLCVAVIGLLLWDPWLARSWGFALSVSASLGILWWASRWRDAMQGWAGRWLAEALCVPLAAQLATQPLITALSGQVSVIGVVANVLAGPFVGPATVLGLTAALASLVWLPLATALGWCAGWAVTPILWIAQSASGLPGASRPVAMGWWTIPLVIVVCLGVTPFLPRLLGSRRAVSALLAVVLLVAWWRPSAPGWSGGWQVASCDVGQGDATVLAAGDGQVVLIDVGPRDGRLVGCLHDLGATAVPLLVLTHYHADHIGALDDLLHAFPVSTVLVNRLPNPAATARSVAERVAAAGGTVVTATPGQVLTVGEATWRTISAPDDAAPSSSDEGESAIENDSSIVGIAEVGGLRVLLAGDSEPVGQSAALRSALLHGLSLRADVLKLPHHGSARQDPAFFAATGASLAVVSAGLNNDYGHPSAKALTLASSLGMQIARTDTEGALALRRTSEGIEVRRAGK